MYSVPKAIDLWRDLSTNKEALEDFDCVVAENARWQRELLLGDIDGELGSVVETLIRFYNQVDDEANIPVEDRMPIKLYIDSGGGDLCATFTIIDAIKLSQTPVWTINIGAAYSGGFFLFIAGHKRIAYPLSTFLYHEGSTMNGGDAGKFRNFAEFYDKQLEVLKNIVLEYTKIDEEMYKDHKKDDWWLTAKEALALGVCDEIITKGFV